MKSACAALLVAMTGMCAAQPTKVYRCGNEISQTPCAGAQEVIVKPVPASGHPEETRRNTARDQALADQMERERLAREAADLKRNARPAGYRLPKPPRAASAPKPESIKLPARRKKK